jgi:hypothetical protein
VHCRVAQNSWPDRNQIGACEQNQADFHQNRIGHYESTAWQTGNCFNILAVDA